MAAPKLPLPAPSGRHTVGCVDVMHDDLLVRLMYPTSPDSMGLYEYVKWFPRPEYFDASAKFMITSKTVPDMTVEAYKNLVIDTIDVCSQALEGAPLLVGPHPYPVIVFSHGLNSIRTSYTATCNDLVSHGYVVAATEHHDRSAALSFHRVPGPGVEEGQYDQYTEEWIEHEFGSMVDFELRNRQVLQRSREVSQTLNLLKLLNDGGEVHNKMGGNFDFSAFRGQLNIDTAAVMGHSFGGSTTVQALHDDQRFKCGVGLDSWMFPVSKEVYENGVSQPLLFINSFDFHWASNVANMMTLVNHEKSEHVSLVTLKGTHHINQCDFIFLAPESIIKKSTLNEVTAHNTNLAICYDFCNRHLLKDPAYQGSVPNLDGGEGADENILFGTNVDYKLPQNDPTDPLSRIH